MASEDQSADDEAIKLDRIERFRSFDELRKSALFQQFLEILFKRRPRLFPGDMDGPSTQELVDYFASHPSIWNEAEECWRNDVRIEAKNLEMIQASANITSHVRRLLARAIQKGDVQLAAEEDRGAIFDFQSRKDKPNRAFQPEFSDSNDAVGNNLAEMGFDFSPAIQAARVPRAGDEGYTGVPDALYEATKRWLRKVHGGWEVRNEDIIYTRDAMTAVQEAVKAFTGMRKVYKRKATRLGIKRTVIEEEKGNVVTCTPTYGGLLHHPKKVFGEDTKTIPLINDGQQLVIDTDALRATLEEGDVFILCNPQNPGGHVYSKAELLEIKEICKEKQVKIIADEVFDGLVFDDNFVSMGSLYEEGEENPTATLLSTGKTFNLGDQPCHMMVIPDEHMRGAFEANRIAGLAPTAIPNRIAIAAFTQSDQWRTELLDYLKRNCDEVCRRIAQMPGLKMTKPQGTYLAWIDASEAGLEEAIQTEFAGDKPEEKGPADYFAKVANVAVQNGSAFDTSGASNMCFRLNFAVPRSELDEMLDRIQGALPQNQ